MSDCTQGIQLQIHYLDGSPTGMLTADVSNWDGHLLFFARNKENRADIRKRPKANNAGIYILMGNLLDDHEHTRAAYIGKAEHLSDRIFKSGDEQEVKGFEWHSAVLVTKLENRLNTAHVLYLEACLIERAKRTKHVLLTNRNDGSKPMLSEADKSAMDKFLHYLFLVLPAIKVDMFSDNTRNSMKKPDSDEVAGDHAFVIEDRNGITATLDASGKEFVVQSGSLARQWDKQYANGSYGARLHERLIKQGVLVPEEQSDRYKFKENYAFTSLSAAASVVKGYPASGLQLWKHRNTNRSYKEWEAEQSSSED